MTNTHLTLQHLGGTDLPYPQADFAAWLEQRGITRDTAAQYASRAGTWLRRLHADPDHARRLFDGKTTSARCSVRAALNHWSVFAHTFGFVPAPALEPEPVLPPAPVCAAIGRLATLTGATWLRNALWADVLWAERILLTGNGATDATGILRQQLLNRTIIDLGTICTWGLAIPVVDPLRHPPDLTDEQLLAPLVPVAPTTRLHCDSRVFAAFVAAGHQAALVAPTDDFDGRLDARQAFRRARTVGAAGVPTPTTGQPAALPPRRPGRPPRTPSGAFEASPPPAASLNPVPTPATRPGRPATSTRVTTLANLRRTNPRVTVSDVQLLLENAEIYADVEAQRMLLAAPEARGWVRNNVPMLLDGAGAVPRNPTTGAPAAGDSGGPLLRGGAESDDATQSDAAQDEV